MHLRAFLILALFTTAAAAQGSKCTCSEGNASYLYLRCPKAPPADPDPCPATHDGIHPNKNPPKAWNNACWLSPRMACFLRRHAASWQITCSLCTKKKCCPFPNWHNCPECHGPAQKRDDDSSFLPVLAKQKKIGGKYTEMAMSPNYVIISDLRRLKIVTSRGAPRPLSQHEMLHLYLQRAEQARAEWCKVFGGTGGSRSMMILMRSESTRESVFCGALRELGHEPALRRRQRQAGRTRRQRFHHRRSG